MATTGSAIGLGNLWRFPFQAGQNGGSAFVFVYLICVLLIAFPILVAELATGRHTGKSAIGTAIALSAKSRWSGAWVFGGCVAIGAAFLVLATYSVIAGQVMAYSLAAFLGEFAGRTGTEADGPISIFASPTHSLFWHSLFMGLTILTVSRGIRGGIERMVNLLMPAFFVMLIGLCAFSLMNGSAGTALDYLFSPRFDELSADVVLAALGQAFFSLGVGAGILTTYGAFLSKDENVFGNAGIVAGADTLVAIVAGVMIFPVVFAASLDPASGMGLIFNALPTVFATMPGGSIIGGVFFLLAFVAAITSAISLLLGVSTVAEQQFGLGRGMSALSVGGAVWVLGTASIFIDGLGSRLDFLSGNVMLPIGGLFVALMAGWLVPKALMRAELNQTSDALFAAWRFLIRYVAPISVLIILAMGLRS